MVGPFRQLPHPREARQLHRLHRLQLQPEAAATTATGDDIILVLIQSDISDKMIIKEVSKQTI